MPYQLHTRAGLAPPFSSTDKRFLNTGSGGGGAGSGAIADGQAGSQIVIELETQLGVFNTAQSATLNYLLHSAVTNTSANNYAGIHWLADGKIRAIAGSGIATRSVTSINSYSTGDVVNIRWVLSFASVTTGLVGTQELFINGVSQGTNGARSDQFAVAASRFALNSVCANDTSVTAERFTDQYIRRFYISYTGGTAYVRDWVFNQATGFEVPNSANAVNDPLRLFGGNGINSLGANWPEDNSQWVAYGGAANESTVSYDLGAIDYAVSSQITAPANAASVGYDLGAIGYAIAAQQLAPGNNASLAYDIGQISYAVSAQQSAPQLSASVGYEIGGIGFSAQANTGIPANAATADYDLGGIGYSVSAQSMAPQLAASLSYDIGSIDYAISANTGAPIRAATVGYDIGDISWQVSAQWQPSDALAIIGYDIGSIGFLVQARSGDVVVSSASDAGLSFKELARGLSFKEHPRGIKFTEPPRGVRV